MNRRTMLQSLLASPLLAWMVPKEKEPVKNLSLSFEPPLEVKKGEFILLVKQKKFTVEQIDGIWCLVTENEELLERDFINADYVIFDQCFLEIKSDDPDLGSNQLINMCFPNKTTIVVLKSTIWRLNSGIHWNPPEEQLSMFNDCIFDNNLGWEIQVSEKPTNFS